MSRLQWTVGEVRITRVVETEVALPPQGLLPDASAEALEPHKHWLCPHFLDEQGQFTLAIQALVVESSGQKILVDTCLGDREMPYDMGERGQDFLRELEAAGFPREDIDVVLCTHLHFDHVGWNTMKEGDQWVPTFPNARYLFARAEYDHWKTETKAKGPGEHTFSFADAVVPIVDAGLANLVETDHELNGEIRLEATPGHTPGHVVVRIESGDESALITGDASHHPVQWAEPDWGMPADSDSKMAAETRRRLLAEHGDTPLLVIGTHYGAPTAGHLVRKGDGFAFIALEN